MILLFFQDVFTLILEYILSTRLFEAYSDIESAKSYIGDSNRMTIYILGTTVSANIYLYNTKYKISSSSIWSSKQIVLLLFNLLVNLGILFIGLHLLHSELVFNSESVADRTRLFLTCHLFLIYFSYLLFGITLWSFLKSFWHTQNMKALYRQLDKLLYPKKYFKIYYNYEKINRYSQKKFQKHLDFIKLKSSKIDELLKLLNKSSAFTYITKFIFRFMIFLYCVWYYISILFFRKHKLIEESSRLSHKKIDAISAKIEILYQNLEYIINSKSDIGMKKYCEEWNSLFSKIIIMLFHIECKNKDEKNISVLYKHLLHNHSKLISLTSSNHQQRGFHKQFIITMFSGLAYKEEYISTTYFDNRSKLLEQIYFEELFELLINLIRDDNIEIFTLLQNDEININSLLASRSDNDKYYGSRNREIKYEELFTSILLKMVELNINKNLPIITAIILSLRDRDIDSKQDIKNRIFPLTMNKKLTEEDKQVKTKEDEQMKTAVKLSFENQKALIYAAIKANEVENLIAAGYIIKIISSNIKLESLVKAIEKINKTPKGKRNIHFYTGIYNMDFNDYSFRYCLDKTLTLICAQYFLKQDSDQNDEFFIFFPDIDYEYFFKKFKLKTKEYNMIALDDDNLDKFKIFIQSVVHHS